MRRLEHLLRSCRLKQETATQSENRGEHDVFHTTETQTRQNSLISKLTSHKDEKFKDEKAPQPQKSHIKSHIVATSSGCLVDFHIVGGQRHMVQIVIIKGCRSQQTPMKHRKLEDKVDVFWYCINCIVSNPQIVVWTHVVKH